MHDEIFRYDWIYFVQLKYMNSKSFRTLTAMNGIAVRNETAHFLQQQQNSNQIKS